MLCLNRNVSDAGAATGQHIFGKGESVADHVEFTGGVVVQKMTAVGFAVDGRSDVFVQHLVERLDSFVYFEPVFVGVLEVILGFAGVADRQNKAENGQNQYVDLGHE